MKKLFGTALAMFTLVLLASCTHTHSWNEASCISPKTCNTCHVTEGEPLSHTFAPATCEQPASCTACGLTEGAPLGHEADRWITTKEPTCSQKGAREATCQTCHQPIMEELDLKEHRPGKWEVKIQPSPGQNGSKIQTCTVCDATIGEKQYYLNGVDTSVLSKETLNFYKYWKAKYLVQNPYVTSETQYYVFYGSKTYAQAGKKVAVTVSEAHGYGMLIAASMAGYDSEAKEIFDGMYRYYRAHRSEIGPNLMAWQQYDTGKALVDSSGTDSATDGDLDIAYALLMADAIWGSDGTYNYKKAAIAIINDIMTYEVNQKDWVLQLGDWAHWSKEGDTYYAATRSSDFLVQYMPVFAEVTGDDRWMKLYDSTYDIINTMVDTYGTGILPDFFIKDSSGSFVPAYANFLESNNDGNYYYNACRTPWRISMDYLINGNEDAQKFADAITSFIIQNTNGDPRKIKAGYTPQGKAVSSWNDLCFNSPFILAAACGDHTDWHDAVRKMCLNNGKDVYYGDTITMLCLIVDDGGWIVPKK